MGPYQPTANEIRILNRGLSFIPTPNKQNNSDTGLLSFFQLKRRMLTQFHFFRLGKVRDPPPFRTKSRWEPPECNYQPLHNFLQNTYNEIVKVFSNNDKSTANMTNNDLQAIQNLQNNHHIVIKPADKGGKIVLWPSEAYTLEAYRQLYDVKYYKQIEFDYTSEAAAQVETFLTHLSNKRLIDPDIYNFLSPTSPVRTPILYLLPKIHKPTKPTPGRPIISGCGSPTENLSKYLDHYLKPIVKMIPSYIQDTTHFLQKIMKHRQSIKRNSFLVTMDVCSLYTNIPHDEGIMYNLQALIHFYGDQLPLPAQHLQQMFVFILKHNYFTFNKRYYLQTHGTAMGATFAPNYANIFMANIEDMLMSFYTGEPKPKLWSRFIDDIFFI